MAVYLFQVAVVLIVAALVVFATLFCLARYEKELFCFLNRFDAWAKKGRN